jgi:histidinol-phosphatase (PHP family)
MICNYHTHTYRCKHAHGTIEEYIEAAIERKVVALGISDHTPLPDNRWLAVRMHIDELQAYSDEIDMAKLKYQHQIYIMKGMECDWAPQYTDFYQQVLLDKYKFDYLIGAAHWFPCNDKWELAFAIDNPEQLIAYAEFYAQAIACGLFSFMAHPDVFCANYDWDDVAAEGSHIILQAAQDYNVPLEINGYGFRKQKSKLPSGERIGYPYHKFWELACNYDIKVFCNSDAHLPEDVIAGIDEAHALVEQLNLQKITFNAVVIE